MAVLASVITTSFTQEIKLEAIYHDWYNSMQQISKLTMLISSKCDVSDSSFRWIKVGVGKM
jgi:hypothetical protein